MYVYVITRAIIITIIIIIIMQRMLYCIEICLPIMFRRQSFDVLEMTNKSLILWICKNK